MYRAKDTINQQFKTMGKVLFILVTMLNYTVLLGLKFVQFGKLDNYELLFMGYLFLYTGIVMYIYINVLFDKKFTKLNYLLGKYLAILTMLCTHLILVFTLTNFGFEYMGIVIQFIIFVIHIYIILEYFTKE